MARADDQFPSHPGRPYQYDEGQRLPERFITEQGILQHENDTRRFVHGSLVDSLRRLIYVFRGGITEPVGNLFKRGFDTLDDVQDGGSYGRTLLSILSGGKIISLLRGGTDEPTTNFFKRNADTLDDVVDGGTYCRPLGRYLNSGRIWQLLRGGVDEPAANFFKRGVDTAADIVETSGLKFVFGGMLDAGRNIVNVLRGGLTEPVGNLFKRGTDTLDDVLDSGSWGRTVASYLNAGRIWRVLRGGSDEDPANLFKRGVDTAADIVETSGLKFIVGSMLDASRNLINVFRGGITEPVGNLFKRGVDTLDDVVASATRVHLLNTARTALFLRRPQSGGNLLVNPSFEDDMAFWSPNAAVSVITDATKARSGNKYLQISSSTGGSSGPADDGGANRLFDVQPGDVIQFGGWGYKEAGDGQCNFVLAAFDKDRANPVYTNAPAYLAADAAWKFQSATYTVPAGVYYVRPYAQIYRATTPTTCRFDDAFLAINRPASQITEDSSRNFVYSGMLDGGRNIINVLRGGLTEPVGNLFKRGVNTLDDVLDSSSWGRTVSSFLSGGKIIKLLRGGADEPSENLFKRNVDTMDNVADGSIFARTAIGFLNGGKVFKLLRSGADEPSENLFKKSADTLASVLDGGGFARPRDSTLCGGVPLTGFTEDFNDQRVFDQRWLRKTGAAVGTVSQVADANFGGNVLRVSGAEAWYEWRENIPFDPNVLYMLSMRVRVTADQTNGLGMAVYCGVAGVGADGTTYVNIGGANDYGSQHYFAAVHRTPTVGGGWTTYTGYFRGWSSTSPGGERQDPNNPGAMHPDVRFFRPLFIVNYAGGDGTTEVDCIVVPLHGITAAGRTNTETRRRNDTLYKGDGALKPVTWERSGTDEPPTNFFKRGADTLDDVQDSTSWGKTVLSYLSGGKIAKLLRSGADEDPANLFKKSVDTFASVSGTIAETQGPSGRAWVASTIVNTAKKIISVVRNGTDESPDNLFKKSVDTADSVAETGGKKFVNGPMLDASRNITNVYRNAVTESVANLFKKGVDTAASIVETAAQKFVNSPMLDASRNIINVLRGGTTEAVTNLFKKGVDTADDVVQGATQAFVPKAALDGSGNVDFASPAVVNKTTDHIYRGPTVLTDAIRPLTDDGALIGAVTIPDFLGLQVNGPVNFDNTVNMDMGAQFAEPGAVWADTTKYRIESDDTGSLIVRGLAAAVSEAVKMVVGTFARTAQTGITARTFNTWTSTTSTASTTGYNVLGTTGSGAVIALPAAQLPAYDKIYKLSGSVKATLTGLGDNIGDTGDARVHAQIRAYVDTGGGYEAVGIVGAVDLTSATVGDAATGSWAASIKTDGTETSLSIRLLAEVVIYNTGSATPAPNPSGSSTLVSVNAVTWKTSTSVALLRRGLYLGAESRHPHISPEAMTTAQYTKPAHADLVEGETFYDGDLHRWVHDDGAALQTMATLDDIPAPTPPRQYVTLVAAGTQVPWSNKPSAEQELFNTTYNRVQIDLSAYTSIQMQAGVGPNIGVAGDIMYLQYSTDNGATWNDLLAGNSLDVSSAGSKQTAWINFATAAKTTVLVRCAGRGGNGSNDPGIVFVGFALK